ncbi:protein hinderin isoform X2 [Pseudophryne corroboree]|uniref:protein hinderin isoform X2 n=1 Tax=Pseudophryne corroboree TaxID=495146 RepID=UPI00308206A3
MHCGADHVSAALTNQRVSSGGAGLGAGCWGAGSGGCLKMADVAGERAAAYWSLDSSDVEQQIVHIPGLSEEGNFRSAPKLKNLKAADRKPRSSHPAPPAKMELTDNGPQVAREEDGMRSASLKDLCPEDKRRIANLIKELARVSEEKEVTEERLKMEHESFAKKIRHLEEQNDLIATEREALQQQYRECQELLGLYQKYLSEQQEKLNLSLSELSARSSKPQQVPKTQRLPTASELNGSYLSQQCRKPRSESESSCSARVCRNNPSPRTGFHCSPDNCAQRESVSSGLPNTHFPDLARSCGSALHQPVSHCCVHRTVHSTPGRYPPEFSLARPPEGCTFSRCCAVSSLSNGVAPGKDAEYGKGVAEQRKHELLLQKMELEIEKERLQQLLEQQEVKLLEMHQQLQQTRPECQRNLAAPKTQTKETAVNTTPSSGTVQLTNGFINSLARPISIGLPTPPSSRGSKNMPSPDGSSSGKKTVGFGGKRQGERSRGSLCPGSRKDAATSPNISGPKMAMEARRTTPQQRDICRYETSLIDMLDAISPNPSQRRQAKYREPYDFRILSPSPRGYSKPSRQPVPPARRPPPAADPEESRILEDIFFIC